MTRPRATQACAEPMVPNTCAKKLMVKTNDFHFGERNCNLGHLFPPVAIRRAVLEKGEGLLATGLVEGGTLLKIFRWKDFEILSWILDDIYGGLFRKLVPGVCTQRREI